MLWMQHPPCLESKSTTATDVIIPSELFGLCVRSCICPPANKCSQHCIKHELEPFATADSPGCPSPTDSEVNMKEPSSSRSLLIVTFVFFFFLNGTSGYLLEVKKQTLLGSNKQPGEVWRLRPTGPLRQKWTDTGQRPCSRYSLAYRTSVRRPHGPV